MIVSAINLIYYAHYLHKPTDISQMENKLFKQNHKESVIKKNINFSVLQIYRNRFIYMLEMFIWIQCQQIR